jgi:hypothetical protein
MRNLRGCLKIQNASTFGYWALLISNSDRKFITSGLFALLMKSNIEHHCKNLHIRHLTA